MPKRPKLRGTGTVSHRHAAEELTNVKSAVATMDAGGRPAADLILADLRLLLTAEAARPATARARFGALSRFFDWYHDVGYVSMNPCALVGRTRRPRAVQARAHFLSLSDLAKLWRATGTLAEVHSDLTRFLIAVPCRRVRRHSWTGRISILQPAYGRCRAQ